jgi:hypothetical protein
MDDLIPICFPEENILIGDTGCWMSFRPGTGSLFGIGIYARACDSYIDKCKDPSGMTKAKGVKYINYILSVFAVLKKKIQ